MKTRNGYPVYPLTVAQKFHTYYVEFSPKKEVLNIGTSLTIGTEIDFEELKKAIYKACERCECMRKKQNFMIFQKFPWRKQRKPCVNGQQYLLIMKIPI